MQTTDHRPSFLQPVADWFKSRFSDPQVLILVLLLFAGFAFVLILGKILAPLIAAVVLAYLLEAVVLRLETMGLRRFWGVCSVFVGFMGVLMFLLLGVVPILSRQITQFIQQIPDFVTRLQTQVAALPERYPNLISQEQLNGMLTSLNTELAAMGQKALTSTLSSVTSIVAFVVFMVLVPVLVFFLMKDKPKIMAWVVRYLPRNRDLASRVWSEVDQQIGNYVRGKVLEIFIVGAVTFAVLSFLGLQYAILLATMVGFSVLIPYIGAAVATIPVAIVALFQFGVGNEFWYVMVAYGIIQLLDGNALVPLLFSEVVDLHPIAIIVAVLLFGGIWGFWGVFFAIPLATLFNAVLRALPDRHPPEEPAAV